jgi:hypothetical protein
MMNTAWGARPVRRPVKLHGGAARGGRWVGARRSVPRGGGAAAADRRSYGAPAETTACRCPACPTPCLAPWIPAPAQHDLIQTEPNPTRPRRALVSSPRRGAACHAVPAAGRPGQGHLLFGADPDGRKGRAGTGRASRAAGRAGKRKALKRHAQKREELPLPGGWASYLAARLPGGLVVWWRCAGGWIDS